MPFAKRLTPAQPLGSCLDATNRDECPGVRRELLPVRSPLLGEYGFMFIPPLTNMLKFSG